MAGYFDKILDCLSRPYGFGSRKGASGLGSFVNLAYGIYNEFGPKLFTSYGPLANFSHGFRGNQTRIDSNSQRKRILCEHYQKAEYTEETC